jgi:phosphomannomutase
VIKRVPIQDQNRRFSLILDPGNGSSCEIAPLLLNRMGFRHITLNSQPDGSFPGRLSEPSSKNLQDVKDFIKVAKNVDLGIALDGDADRVVFIDSKGQVVEPIRILTFLAREYYKDHSPLTGQSPIVVTPLNSSGVIEYILEPLGIKVVRTQIGDIKVAIEIKNTQGFLGGENIGTYIWPNFHFGPDSIMTIAMLLSYVSKSSKPFDELLKDIPEFPFLQIEYELKVDRPFTKKDYTILCDKTLSAFKAQGYHYLRHEFIDGVQIFFTEGWVLIRKSGTTPILRLTVESKLDLKSTQQMRKIAEEILKKYIE